MILGNNRLLPAMSVGYSPVCASKVGLWPCYPMMPRFGVSGLGAVNPVIPRPGLSDLSMDGSGILGTGLFGTSWGMPEVIVLAIGVPLGIFAMYSMFHQTKQTGYRLEARGRRKRVSKAAKLRAKAKRLEEKEGGWFGF